MRQEAIDEVILTLERWRKRHKLGQPDILWLLAELKVRVPGSNELRQQFYRLHESYMQYVDGDS